MADYGSIEDGTAGRRGVGHRFTCDKAAINCTCDFAERSRNAADPVYEDRLNRWRWLESTRRLQSEAYGRERPDSIAGQASALKENLLAALVELAGEVPREFAWKYWAHDEPWVNRQKVLDEVVDVMHFLGNMLDAIGVTDDEYEAAYQAKQLENRRRQTDGYAVRKEGS